MLKTLLRWLVIWRLLLFIPLLLAAFTFPLKPGFTDLTNAFSFSDLLTAWSNFDGRHYLTLAEFGYRSPQAFNLQNYFPIYPLIVGQLGHLIRSYLISGLLISHLAFFAALYLLYKLLRLDYSHSTARKTIVLILAFPASFIFGSVYSESLFFLFAVGVFYFARKGQFLPAAIFASIAGATRVTGFLLFFSLGIEYLIYIRDHRKKFFTPQLIWFFLLPIGFYSYVHYLGGVSGDPLLFLHVQPLNSGPREINHVVLLYEVFYRYMNMLIDVPKNNPLFFTVLQEMLIGLLFTAVSIPVLKNTRLSYALFTLLSFILPTLMGSFASLPRFVAVLFPGFLVLSLYFHNHPRWYRPFITICLSFQFISVYFFTRGWFVL